MTINLKSIYRIRMKTFLIFIAAIAIICALILGYLYNQFTYKPDYFDEIEQVDIEKISQHAIETEQRITRDLDQEGYAKLNGEEIMQLVLNQLSRNTDVDINSIIKKTNCEMIDGKLKTEALIDLKALSRQKVPAHARQYIETFLHYVPDAMMEEVYVAFEGTPVINNGSLHFANDVVVSIGDFNQKIYETGNRDLELDLDILYKMGASKIIMRDSYIELKK